MNRIVGRIECAVAGCDFTTKSRAGYATHRFAKHRVELNLGKSLRQLKKEFDEEEDPENRANLVVCGKILHLEPLVCRSSLCNFMDLFTETDQSTAFHDSSDS